MCHNLLEHIVALKPRTNQSWIMNNVKEVLAQVHLKVKIVLYTCKLKQYPIFSP